ncbi:cytochrome-c peroxidase [Marinirhabdus gelatinilytica]|uniref:Cytochrome c peroxidase n=1 Tax=Marinirhabdus gelatinilytica TaxID=1703343 RepID=A0A370QIN4_9FLAO|nr:cytochrome c peroxidase [Marinirhabdus gelatinilytica]RDK88224.1 cytochrome c peroxidase [Marinirhabdus gelatinilytica]
MKKVGILSCLVTSLLLFTSCEDSDDTAIQYMATPAPLEVPTIFQDQILPPVIPEDNPQTAEGIALGKKLFFDRNLSADGSISCASCHAPQAAFSDNRQFSIGITGEEGFRNSMPLQNLVFNYDEKFNWDGSANSLESQMFEPVVNPIEMANTWANVESTLQDSNEYPQLFEEAFGTQIIDSTLVTKALAQFVRTLVTANSRFDQAQLGLIELTPQEQNGLNVFLDESRGDCFHCHGLPANPLWTDNAFHNNGLDEEFDDLGLGNITGDPRDFGLFRTPSLRNLKFTAPYMHDGRFATLDEVIDHYSEGLVFSPTIDPLMKAISEGGVQLSEEDKADLKAFLLSLSDDSFINNPDFRQ